MRVIVLVKASEESEAGVMLAGEGLHPSSRGKRIGFDGDKRTVIDGPFAETKELVAGYTLIQVRSREEALEWSRRFPNPVGEGARCEVEVRQLYEMDDFEFLASPQTQERFRKMGME